MSLRIQHYDRHTQTKLQGACILYDVKLCFCIEGNHGDKYYDTQQICTWLLISNYFRIMYTSTGRETLYANHVCMWFSVHGMTPTSCHNDIDHTAVHEGMLLPLRPNHKQASGNMSGRLSSQIGTSYASKLPLRS